ncbi:MAG TPA: hypothetical protein PLH95_03565 [Thauera aminoaromatica]|nr:hypothetical protein [Thauera aminoaromatica]
MTDGSSTIYFDLAAGDRIEIEGCVHVEMQGKHGRHARLKVVAPRSVRVQRGEPEKRPAEPATGPAPNIAD